MGKDSPPDDGGAAAPSSEAGVKADGSFEFKIAPPESEQAMGWSLFVVGGVTFIAGVMGFSVGLAVAASFHSMMWAGLGGMGVAVFVQFGLIDVWCNPPTLANASLKFTLGAVIGAVITFTIALIIGAVFRELFFTIFGAAASPSSQLRTS